jgi:nucleoid-associated protein YgaU
MFSPPPTTAPGAHAAFTPRPGWQRAVTGLAALVALVAFLAALPVALWTWRHNPLPTSWEPQRWWMLAWGGFVHPDVVANALAVATWLMWAQVVFALARETAARVHRRVAASRSALVLPGVQELARGWVTAVSLVLTVAASRPESAHSLAALPAAASVAAFDTPTAAVADVRQPPTGDEADQHHAGTVHTCDRYETLRSLASRHYGDAARWTRIRDASVGLRQSDGTRLPTGFVAVDEGTRLLIPADATVADIQLAGQARAISDREPSPRRPLDPTATKHVVEKGDTLWDIAEASYPDADQAEIPRIVRAIYKANRRVEDGNGHVLHDPDLINPGMTFRLPVLPADKDDHPKSAPRKGAPQPKPKHTQGRPSPAPAQPAPSAPSPSAPTQGEQTPSARPDTPTAAPKSEPGVDLPASAAPEWVGAATLLATGFIGLWAFRRRRRDSKSRPDRVAPPDDPTLFGLHTTLGAAEDTDAVRHLDTALRILAAQHVDGSPVPQVILRRADGELEVFFGSPCGFLPKPWLPRSDLRIWALPGDARLSLDIRPGLADMPAPCPGLVQLGTTDDHAELYVDLEAIGVLTLATGQDAAVLRGIARAITATLAVSPLAGIPRVRTVGFDPFGLAAEERVIAETTIDDVLDHAAADTEYIRRGLRDTGVDTTMALRVLHPEDGSDPTIAILGRATVSSEHVRRLADLVGGGGRGVAVLGPDDVGLPGPWRLAVQTVSQDEERVVPWRLEPVGIAFTPLLVAAEELRDLGALLAEAETPLVSVPHEPPPAVPDAERRDLPGEHPPVDQQVEAPADGRFLDAAAETVPGEPVLTKAVPGEPEWQVMVRLLGPVDAISTDGQAAEGVRDRTVEVLAWLVAAGTPPGPGLRQACGRRGFRTPRS